MMKPDVTFRLDLAALETEISASRRAPGFASPLRLYMPLSTKDEPLDPRYATPRDGAFVRRAVEAAHPNALRMALYLATRDPDLAAMTPSARRARGGSVVVPQLHVTDRASVAEKAIRYLTNVRPAPSHTLEREEAEELLRLFGADVSTPAKLRLALDEVGLPNALREPSADLRVPPEIIANRKVVIVGAGISGLAAAIRCQAAGLSFEILERQADIGGTWNLNDYPEARVDISNFVYQFRFEPTFRWKELYSRQGDIKAYLAYIVATYGLGPHIRLGCELQRATWDACTKVWRLEVESEGEAQTLTTNFLVSASGLFNTPSVPAIPGLEKFEGTTFHTTNWNHGYEVRGKRVALIGNGSTGVQVMPWLAERAERLTVFQRTPNWITPIEDYYLEVSAEQQWLFDLLPTYWNWYCFAMMLVDKQSEDLQVDDPAWAGQGGRFNQRNDRLRNYLEDYVRKTLAPRPELIEACIPKYPPLARRLVVDSGWFRSLLRDNVELVSGPVREICAEGVVAEDGRLFKVDAIVLGTGFRVENFLSTADYVGQQGVHLQDTWKVDGARAYLGMFVPQFPNLAIFYGPNGQPQTGSFHDWADRWARCTVDLIIATLAAGRSAFAVKPEAFESYNEGLDAAMSRMVWGREDAGGYYVNSHGRPITKMPWRSEDYFAQIDHLDLNAFEIT